MSDIDPPDVLTVPQAARELHVTRMTVRRMVEDGRLTPIDPINRAVKRQRYRFRRVDVERLARDGYPPRDAAPRLLAEPPEGYDPRG